MSTVTNRYQYIDEDGDVQRFNYIERFCMCSGSCEDNELEYFDPLDPPGSSPYRLPNICGHEMKNLIQDLIDIGIAAGKITEVPHNE